MKTKEKLSELIELIKFMLQVDNGINVNHTNWLLEQLNNLQDDL